MSDEDKLPEIRLNADNPRMAMPDGTVYEASYLAIELTPEELAAEDAEAERQDLIRQGVVDRLDQAGLSNEVMLVGSAFTDGELTRVTLTAVDGGALPPAERLEAALGGLPYRIR